MSAAAAGGGGGGGDGGGGDAAGAVRTPTTTGGLLKGLSPSANLEQIANIFIRPPRDNYAVQDMGASEFIVGGVVYCRRDVVVRNARGMALHGSHFGPAYVAIARDLRDAERAKQRRAMQRRKSEASVTGVRRASSRDGSGLRPDNSAGPGGSGSGGKSRKKGSSGDVKRGRRGKKAHSSKDKAGKSKRHSIDATAMSSAALGSSADGSSSSSTAAHTAVAATTSSSSTAAAAASSTGATAHGARRPHEAPSFKASLKVDELPCVVYLHGNSGSRLDAFGLVPHLLGAGVTVFCFDFSGSGMSDGEYITLGWREKEDLRAVVEFLWSADAPFPVNRIALWGRSMGAATALLYTSTDPSISCAVCDSPFSSLSDVAVDVCKGINSKIPRAAVRLGLKVIQKRIRAKCGLDIRTLEVKDVVGSCFVPALFCHGRDDKFVKPYHSEVLHARYAGDKNLVMVDGNHNSARPGFFITSAIIFLSECFGLQLASVPHPHEQAILDYFTTSVSPSNVLAQLESASVLSLFMGAEETTTTTTMTTTATTAAAAAAAGDSDGALGMSLDSAAKASGGVAALAAADKKNKRLSALLGVDVPSVDMQDFELMLGGDGDASDNLCSTFTTAQDGAASSSSSSSSPATTTTTTAGGLVDRAGAASPAPRHRGLRTRRDTNAEAAEAAERQQAQQEMGEDIDRWLRFMEDGDTLSHEKTTTAASGSLTPHSTPTVSPTRHINAAAAAAAATTTTTTTRIRASSSSGMRAVSQSTSGGGGRPDSPSLAALRAKIKNISKIRKAPRRNSNAALMAASMGGGGSGGDGASHSDEILSLQLDGDADSPRGSFTRDDHDASPVLRRAPPATTVTTLSVSGDKGGRAASKKTPRALGVLDGVSDSDIEFQRALLESFELYMQEGDTQE